MRPTALEQTTKPGSKAAMRIALQTVHDYFEMAERAQSEMGKWWAPMLDTVFDVRHALGQEDTHRPLGTWSRIE
jgi:hypothetical protein